MDFGFLKFREIPPLDEVTRDVASGRAFDGESDVVPATIFPIEADGTQPPDDFYTAPEWLDVILPTQARDLLSALAK